MSHEENITKVLSKFEYGIYVVTMGKGEDGNGLTVSWLTQVSSQPPMIVVAIKNEHQSNRLLQESDTFVVNILSKTQVEMAKAYYGPAESGYRKLEGRMTTPAPETGCPIINGSVGFLDCRIVKRVPTGNHTVFIGEVVAAKIDTDADILTSSSAQLRYTG